MTDIELKGDMLHIRGYGMYDVKQITLVRTIAKEGAHDVLPTYDENRVHNGWLTIYQTTIALRLRNNDEIEVGYATSERGNPRKAFDRLNLITALVVGGRSRLTKTQ